MIDKIRILHCGENNGSYSGFGKYSRELFSRLVNNDRFELAELSSFATVEDEKLLDCKWKCYPAAVSRNDPRYNEFISNPENKHGFWRFERVCLDFRPHIVLDIRDPWNMFFEGRSPYRDMYHWVISPTVDSDPQQDEWIEVFMGADAVFTYSDYGLNTLKEQSAGKIKLKQAIYSGVDQNIYKPLDKKEVRKKFGVPEDYFIIGTVMRNQQRKLFPELFKMFRALLDKYSDHPIIKKTYLYCHTSYPDNGWDIPALLRDNGISNRVIFTYQCGATKKPFCSHYEGVLTYSPHANAVCGKMPNVIAGLSEDQLAEVFNIFDLHIQYASNEGLGIPMLEAASCGIPLAGINYSAMADNIRITGGIPLSYSKRFEPNTMAYRAVPDEKKNIEEIFEFINLPEAHKKKIAASSLIGAKKYFNWDINAKTWSDYFESVQIKDNWNRAPKTISNQYPQIPDGLSNFEYIKWLAEHVAKNKSLAYSYLGLKTLGGISSGLSREDAYNKFKIIGDNLYEGEEGLRYKDKMRKDDFIEFAHLIEEKYE